MREESLLEDADRGRAVSSRNRRGIANWFDTSETPRDVPHVHIVLMICVR